MLGELVGGGAVFAQEPLELEKTLFQRFELVGIGLDLDGVSTERARNFGELVHGRFERAHVHRQRFVELGGVGDVVGHAAQAIE